MWVVTPKEKGCGGAPDSVIARSAHLGRWPWEVEGWTVCGRGQTFVESPKMQFALLNPAAELVVTLPAVGGGMVASKYRCAGLVHGRPAFRSVDDGGAAAGAADGDSGGASNLRLFWMSTSSRWMLGAVEDGGGVQNLIARSVPDDGSSWASLWPWEAEAQAWEAPTTTTKGLQDGDAKWIPEKGIHVKLSSPGVAFRCEDEEAPAGIEGCYEQQGMCNGRVYYMQQLKDEQLDGFTGPKCLWFAEDRGQWVVTPPNLLGNSRTVMARISSRAWWPWEAHLGGSTSPHSLGATPFATLPPWHGGTTVLASGRASWEVADEETGALRQAQGTLVELDPEARCARVRASDGARHPFMGLYVRAGIVSARPFFLQTQEDPKKKSNKKPAGKHRSQSQNTRAWAWKPPTEPRYALWYCEDPGQWVITEDFRLLDALTVDARVTDSAWFPWEVASIWEVADGLGGFVLDINMKVEEV